ncbi:MAG: prepilin-type N-terminal cleavage/methylation domain-containing protein [Candidatus Saccharimonadales bacterium]
MRAREKSGEIGFTLVELTITMFIIAIVMASFFALFISLVDSTILAKHRAVALSLATNQMEYLKSLPFDGLTVQSPSTLSKVINGMKYDVKTTIKYIDDAYDGCGSYPSQEQKELYCRNYPPPAGAPVTDLNPADYKDALVSVTDKTGAMLASVDTQISARVSETASTTGALFVTVTNPSGTPISGATVVVSNSTLSPTVNKQDDTDSNGTVIFYGLPPDNGKDYVISANKTNYSNLSTIGASGTLQPTYANQNILTQKSSFVTLVLGQQSGNSLLVEATDTNGNPLPNAKVYIKGGYKMYTDSTNSSYYYDNDHPSDNRPTTDSAGLIGVQNLPPINSYLFCGDDGSTGCSIGGTTYYLAAAVPYSGNNSLQPIVVPQYDPANPPTATFLYGDAAYLQKARLILTTSYGFPRVFTMSPDNLSLASDNLSNFQIIIKGKNLGSAGASLKQGANNYAGSCTTADTQLTCSFNLAGVTTGSAQLMVSNGSGTLTLPVAPMGGFNVNP